jgi:hypothetical protein
MRRPGRFPGEVREARRLDLANASPFARLAAAHGLGMAGDLFLTVALSGSLFFKVSPAAARPKLVLYLMLTMAPFAVVAPVLGPVLDRFRGGRRLTFAVSCIGRAVAVWEMARYLHSALLYPLAFVVLVLSKAQAVTKAALVPVVIEGDQTLVEANSRLALIAVVVGVVAAFPAALILKVLDAAWVLRAGAIVYIAAFVFALRVPRPDPTPADQSAAARQEVKAGTVRLASTGMALLRGGVGYTTFLLAFALKRADPPAPAWRYGLVLGLSALGSLAGNAVAPIARRKLREEIILVGSLLLPAVVALFCARSQSSFVPPLIAFAIGAGGAAGKIAFDSLVQRDAPSATQGRAFARFETRFQLAWVAGALMPVALSHLRLRFGLFVLALVLGFAGLSYFGESRRLRTRVASAVAHDVEAGEP